MSDADRQPPNPTVKLAIELGPLVAFFVAQRRWDLIVATGVFMGAMVVSVIASRRLEGRWPTMPLIPCCDPACTARTGRTRAPPPF